MGLVPSCLWFHSTYSLHTAQFHSPQVVTDAVDCRMSKLALQLLKGHYEYFQKRYLGEQLYQIPTRNEFPALLQFA
jgi:hypothetical protein